MQREDVGARRGQVGSTGVHGGLGGPRGSSGVHGGLGVHRVLGGPRSMLPVLEKRESSCWNNLQRI
ncbi:hypothetical protein EYF80_059214 [Liparis tanakae]|uniref:Uncharacterized protein n=1 Tax=Liparis tanakae TaxID=230148 RepID=A0A4Z2EQI1_9TELE|nr:hypothetical protein EYF80_059214 [Liparis tanakae]